MKELIERVRELHKLNGFRYNGGEDKRYRMMLIMEEVGEICESITKNTDNFEEEHADLMILLLGNCVAYGIDIEHLVNDKLDRLMKMHAITDDEGFTRIITSHEE